MKTSAQAPDVPVKEAFVASTWNKALKNTDLGISAKFTAIWQTCTYTNRVAH